MAKTPRGDKPAKPYPGFPLYAHATGRWAKKIRGKLHYFGPWSDPAGAEAKYNAQREDLHAGRVPQGATDTVTLGEICNHFEDSKLKAVADGELAEVTWLGYEQAIRRMLEHIPATRQASRLTPEDFRQLRDKLANGKSPTTLANDITRLRVLFRYANERRLTSRPIDLGPDFKKPSRRVLRAATAGEQMFEAEEVRRLVVAASPQMRAMVLLGINCGFGNEDCAGLHDGVLNLSLGWHVMPRGKNGNPRRCPLWGVTVEAIRAARQARPRPADPADAGLCLLTAKGKRWARPGDRPLSKAFRKLLAELDLYRPGLNFYSLRRTFRTVADESLDAPAVNWIMGHIDPTMGGVYRQRISDERLIGVTYVVADWLLTGASRR